jgi:hypothetical protein
MAQIILCSTKKKKCPKDCLVNARPRVETQSCAIDKSAASDVGRAISGIAATKSTRMKSGAAAYHDVDRRFLINLILAVYQDGDDILCPAEHGFRASCIELW